MSQCCRAHLFFRCAFDSAKFKVWNFFACLIFFSIFLWTCLSNNKKRHDRHNETLWTTDFFNSVFCLVHPKSSSIFQSCERLKSDTSAAQKKKKKKLLKKNAFRSGLPICHELWDIAFVFLALLLYFKKKFKPYYYFFFSFFIFLFFFLFIYLFLCVSGLVKLFFSLYITIFAWSEITCAFIFLRGKYTTCNIDLHGLFQNNLVVQ